MGTLSLKMMGLTPRTAGRLAAGGLLDRVHTLDLSHCQALGDRGLQTATPANGPPRLRSLAASRARLGDGAVWWACVAGSLAGLRHLDLSSNPLGPDGLRPFDRDTPPPGLRSLGLAGCTVTDLGVKRLTASAVWPNLVELDLRLNPLVGDTGARHLLQAETPPGLTALLLAGTAVGDGLRGQAAGQVRRGGGV